MCGHWTKAPVFPDLPHDEVHVWRARLDAPAPAVPELRQLLSADEIVRADRFRFPVHRNRYIVRRGTLRLLLGLFLRSAPAGLAFDYTAYGKPSLAVHHRSDVRFNLSFSEDYALYAFSRGRNLGVDIERIRDEAAGDDVAAQFFAASELRRLRALPATARHDAFFECWVRKEAYIKARGLGLSLALDSFEVSFGDGGPARLLRTAPDPDDAVRWVMAALHPAPGYAGALAVESPGCPVRCWSWPIHAGSPDSGRDTGR